MQPTWPWESGTLAVLAHVIKRIKLRVSETFIVKAAIIRNQSRFKSLLFKSEKNELKPNLLLTSSYTIIFVLLQFPCSDVGPLIACHYGGNRSKKPREIPGDSPVLFPIIYLVYLLKKDRTNCRLRTSAFIIESLNVTF